VLVVDDHPVVRDGVELLLRHDPRMRVIAGATTVREAVDMAGRFRPHVVLLDLHLADTLAIDAVELLRGAAPEVRVIVFTAYGRHASIRAAIEAGVDGCLLKDATGTDLVNAIRRVMNGERVFDPRLSERIASNIGDRIVRAGLTRREYDVLRLVAAGKTNPEIAQRLGLTRNTVKSYLANLMQKLDARNRVEAIGRAHEAALL
jgi:two-component system nitrate/nitrite response regulator NarL